MRIKINHLITLSKRAKKYFRNGKKNKWNNKYSANCSEFNGIFYIDNNTYLTKSYWFFEIKGEIKDDRLVLAEKQSTNNLFIRFWKDNLDEVELNEENMIQKDGYLTIKFEKSYFDAELLFKDVLSMFKNPKFYINKDEKMQNLQIVEDKIRCIVCPLRELTK